MKLSQVYAEAILAAKPEDAQAFLVAGARAFLRSGVSLDDWALLDDAERAALVTAAEQLAAEDAYLTCCAIHAPAELLAIRDPIAYRQAVLDAAAKGGTDGR